MLTKDVYHIQLKNRKNSTAGWEFFLHTFVVRTMFCNIMSSFVNEELGMYYVLL